MTIEVRQLLIKSQVDTTPAASVPPAWIEEARERVKEEILAECKSWLAQQLQNVRER
jgi:hypothetical protein